MNTKNMGSVPGFPPGFSHISAIAIICPFLFWLSRYINLDFWYDEAFTLQNYVFVPLGKTVTDYSFPNNHILFNLINSIYLKSIGVGSIFSLMDWPYKIRLLPLVYALITILYLYLIGMKFFNKFIADLSLIILVSTIPYYNFALQVRGYGLSMMLLCIMLYHLWNFEKSPRFADALLVVFSAALAIYTIPLNLYFILGVMIFYFSLGAKAWKLRSRPEEVGDKAKWGGAFAPWRDFCSENRQLAIAFLAGLGTALAVLLYLPVIDEVAHNRFVKSHGLFSTSVLLDTLPRAVYYFVSGRYLLIPVFILGCFIYTVSNKKKEPRLTRKAICCSALFLLPFFLSFIRGDQPWLRVFVNLTPLFALLVSISIYFLQSSIPALRSRAMLITVVTFLYCNATFAFSISNISRRIWSDIETGHKSQDIFYNYYQAHYYPMRLARNIARNYEPGPKPWERVVLYHCDEAAMPAYLAKFAIGFTGRDALKPMLASQERVYVVTAFPNNFEKMVAEKYPHVECKRLNDPLQFHNFFVLTRPENR